MSTYMYLCVTSLSVLGGVGLVRSRWRSHSVRAHPATVSFSQAVALVTFSLSDLGYINPPGPRQAFHVIYLYVWALVHPIISSLFPTYVILIGDLNCGEVFCTT